MFKRILHIVLFLFLEATVLHAETICDLWNLSEEDWETMNRYERYHNLSAAVRTSPNKEFYGRFWSGEELYRKWGYDYYELQPYYENYAYRNFENYAVMNNRRQRWSYDIFGDRIIKMGGTIDYWREQFNQDGSWEKNRFKKYITTGLDRMDSNGVTLASDSSRDWAAKLIFAGGLRNVFTPMTLKLDMTPGMRFDFWSPNNHLTMLRSFNEIPFGKKDNTILTGLRYIRKIGALNLGTTYVNLHQHEGMRAGSNNRRGTLPTDQFIPAIIAIKFADDSPEDGIGGPHVQNIGIVVNGQSRPDIKPELVRQNSGNKMSALGTVSNKGFTPNQYMNFNEDWPYYIDIPPYDYWQNMEIPYYADYVMRSILIGYETMNSDNKDDMPYPEKPENYEGSGSNMISHVYGGNLDQRMRSALLKRVNEKRLHKWIEWLDPVISHVANGHDYLVYYFDLSGIDEVWSISVECIVGNDYEISYSLISVDDPEASFHIKPEEYLTATYWKVVKEAPGNVRDLSNMKQVHISIGSPTGIEYLGFDFDAAVRGFQIRGEYSHGIQWRQYPDSQPWTKWYYYEPGLPPRKGEHNHRDDKAYWLTFRKDLQYWGFGGEIYYYGPQYEIRLWVQDRSSYSENNTMFIPTIEDNDDNDMFPDQWNWMFTGNDWAFNLNNTYATEDIDGVFPGLDVDNDGVPDTNKNANELADYVEPFLRFYSDPPEYLYGDDFNNNGVPDHYEDDLEPDTPYDRGQRGTHLFFNLKPLQYGSIIMGLHKGRLISGGGRNHNLYTKLQFEQSNYFMKKIFFEIKHEYIQDNIPDYVYIFNAARRQKPGPSMGGRVFVRQFDAEWVDDPMMYRDSQVLRVYLHTESRRYLGLSLLNQIRYEINHQKGGILYDGTFQFADRVSYLTMVNRINGLYRSGKWSAMPGLKLRLLKRERKSLDIPLAHERTIIPRFIVRCDLTERTHFSAGAEILPWLPFSYRNLVLTNSNRDEQNYILELSNMSDYMGYTIYAFAGFQFTKGTYESYRGKYVSSDTSAYLRIILGY